MKYPILLFSFFLITHPSFAQNNTKSDTLQPSIKRHTLRDTSKINEVVVTGFGTERNRLETPASVATVPAGDLQRYNNTSLVPAINEVPGVVMEERSPGSYRISIRGSSIRSPFGIRNVKIYLDGVPLTDAGGNTNLNFIDFHAIGKIEVVKGPTGSVYGAGSGGTILLTSKLPVDSGRQAWAEYSVGSYGLRNLDVGLSTSSQRNQTAISFSDVQATGYRVNTAMSRRMFRLTSHKYISEKESLLITGFYSDLFYQTPGALTLAEYTANPRQSRPATKTSPSAVAQKLAIYRKEIFAGLVHKYRWNEHWDNTATFYVSGDQFKNPFLTNYERELEMAYGARNVTRFSSRAGSIPFRVLFGGEYQYIYASDRNYGNLGGIPDTLQSDNELKNIQYFAFAQLEADLPWNLILNAGLSYNHLSYHVLNLYAVPSQAVGSSYHPVAVPRAAILKKFDEHHSVYFSVSSGYSPPANSEALESTGQFNTTLRAETALSYELGYKGNVWNNRFNYDITLFDNQVSNTIVQREDASGNIFFVNEGSTVEKGIEIHWDLMLLKERPAALSSLRLWNSVAINDFYFKNETLGTNLVSGNPLTGTAPYSSSLGLDAGFFRSLYLNLTGRYSDRIPLNDENTAKANYFVVFDGRLGYKKKFSDKFRMEVFSGIGNAFNRKYSLGNDLNGFGGRYYNAAPGRNYFAGLSLSY